MKPTSIILLSGGLDSTLSATIAVKKTKPLFALTIDYGQRSARMEALASKKIARALRIKHRIVKLPFFQEFTKCRLIGIGKIPPHKLLKLRDVWVPNRNALFINVAACFAEYYNADLIVTGFNFEEAREFPDNRKEFIDAINKTLRLSTLKKIKVISYVTNYTKKAIYQLGLKYRAPLQHIYSCYWGGKKMCGRCASCLKLKSVAQKFF